MIRRKLTGNGQAESPLGKTTSLKNLRSLRSWSYSSSKIFCNSTSPLISLPDSNKDSEMDLEGSKTSIRGTINTVLTIDELNDITQGVSSSSIVVDHDVFQCFNQTTLNVTGLSCLDGGINKTFSTSHSVEEEFLWSQTSQIRVLDKALGLWRVVILGKVRQGTVRKSEGNTLTFDNSLTDTGGHSRNVNKGTLGTRSHHLLDIVQIFQVHFSRTTSGITSLIKNTRNIMLERFSQRHTWLRFQLVLSGIENDFLHLLLSFSNSRGHITHGFFVSNGITDTNGETVIVDQTTTGCTNSLLVDHTKHNLTIHDQHAFIVGRDHVGAIIGSLQVNTLWNGHGQQSLTGPHGLGLEDSWRWNNAIPVGNPVKHVHHLLIFDEGVTQSHLSDTTQSVLHNTHDWLIRSWRHNLKWHCTNLRQLGSGFLRLRNMQVHFVTIEIGVVWRCNRQVQSEGGVRHNLNSVSHHRHFMQRGLSVEQHRVVIHQVTLDLPAILQSNITCSLIVSQVNTITCITNDILCTRMLIRTVSDVFGQFVNVVWSHDLRVCQRSCNGDRHTDLVKIKIWITRNDCTSGKVHTFTHKVTSQPTFLTLQSCSDRFDRTTSLLKSLRSTSDIVVHVSCDVELQQCFELADNVLGRTINFKTLNVDVGLQDICQLESQVILTSGCVVEGDGWSDWWRRNGQDRDQHPLGSCVVLVEAHLSAVLCTDVSENAKNLRRVQQPTLWSFGLVVGLISFPRSPQFHTVSADGGLGMTTTTSAVSDLAFLVYRVGFTDHLCFTNIPHCVKPLLWVSYAEGLCHQRVCVVDQKLATVHTNTLTDLLDLGDETNVEHGLGQLDVAKMARALSHVLTTGLTLEVTVDGAQSRVIQTTVPGFLGGSIHGFWVLNLGDRDCSDFLR